MRHYEISYYDEHSTKYKECFQFPNEEKLDSFFQRYHARVNSVKEVTQKYFIQEIERCKKLTSEEVIELVTHLHIIIKAALPLHHSLEDLAFENSNKRMRKILFYLSHSIANGNSLSSSLQPFYKLFGFSTIYLIRIGEETGSLEQTLAKAKKFLIQNAALKRKIRLALIYPLMVLSVSSMAIILWFTFVLPQMAEMFVSMDIELPWLTRALIFMSDIIGNSYLFIFGIIALVWVTIWQMQKRSYNVRKNIHRRILHLPMIGTMLVNYNVAYITEFLYLSTSTGTSLFKAIKIIGDNIENIIYRESMKNIVKHLEHGSSLSHALQKEKIYNAFTIRMLNTGEQSGDLESQLYTISEYYTQNVRSATTQITKVIEPVMIVVVGFIFAIMMVGLMGPIFEIMSMI